MRIGLDASSMQDFRWRDYAVRFVFGGIVTVLTGLIAKRYGPGVAGLFLAFPAIFSAGATLIEKQEMEKKRQTGLDGTPRGRAAVGIDAVGAALGSLGLIAFASRIWRFCPITPVRPSLPSRGWYGSRFPSCPGGFVKPRKK